MIRAVLFALALAACAPTEPTCFVAQEIADGALVGRILPCSHLHMVGE